MDFVLDNFGPLELILFVELAVLATATFFYLAAKIITGKNRNDPMVRFYYVFWRAFTAPVTPVGVMVAQQAEAVARAKGVVMVGDATPEQLAQMDAPDLNTLSGDDLRGTPVRTETSSVGTAPPGPGGKTGKATEPAPAADSTLEVHIVGRSERDEVAGHAGKSMVIHVRCEIEDGQANGVVVDLAAKSLGVPVYRVVLLRGHYKSDKGFKIIGMSQATLDAQVARL